MSAHLRASTERVSVYPACRRPHMTLVCRLLSDPTQHAGVPTASHGVCGRSVPAHHSGLSATVHRWPGKPWMPLSRSQARAFSVPIHFTGGTETRFARNLSCIVLVIEARVGPNTAEHLTAATGHPFKDVMPHVTHLLCWRCCGYIIQHPVCLPAALEEIRLTLEILAALLRQRNTGSL